MRGLGAWTRSKAAAAAGVTIAASVAIAIVSTTATSVLAYALLWRPLGVAAPERLVHVAVADAQGRQLPVPSWTADVMREQQLFDSQCRFVTPYTTMRMDGRVTQGAILAASAECFATLGTTAAIGRLFSTEEERQHAHVAIITHRTWMREYAGRPDVIGSLITLDGLTFTIVGITESRFDGLQLGFPAYALVPLDAYRAATGGEGYYWANLFARMRPESDATALRQRIADASRTLLATTMPADTPAQQRSVVESARVDIIPAGGGIDYVIRDRFLRPVVALLLLAALVAAISLSNVAHLFMAHLLARRQELAMRLVLGGSRWRLVRSAARDGLVVAGTGAIVGTALAAGLSRALAHQLGSIYDGLVIDPSLTALPILLVALTIALALVILAGATLMVTRRVNLADLSLLRQPAASGHWTRRIMLSVAVLLTTILVTVDLLALRSLRETTGVDTGVTMDGVVAARLMPLPEHAWQVPPAGHYTSLVDRLAALPGVRHAALTRTVPFYGRPYVEPVTTDTANTGTAPSLPAEQHVVTEAFFDALGIGLVSGRTFTRADDGARMPVAVLSRSLAEQLFGGEDAVGRQVWTAQLTEPLTVIGVVRDVALLEPKGDGVPALYRSYWQLPQDSQAGPDLVVTLASADLATTGAGAMLTQAVEQGGVESPVGLMPLADRFDRLFIEDRIVAWLGSLFSLAGLAVSMIGIGALTFHALHERRRELGVRAALGATPLRLQGTAASDAFAAVLPGWLLGIPGAALVSHTAATIIGYGGSAIPLVALAAVIVGLAALIAAQGPGRRAARTSPMAALNDR